MHAMCVMRATDIAFPNKQNYLITVLEPTSSMDDPWDIPMPTSLGDRFCLSELDLDTEALLWDASVTGMGTGTESAFLCFEPRGGCKDDCTSHNLH